MPRTRAEIIELLDGLDDCVAEDLEDQDLDFKQWDERSDRQSVRMLVSAAVCMANGGGGTVVLGVADRRRGRDSAIQGVPPVVSVNRLRLAVHDGTDSKLTPVFEEVMVPEGTGRVILMHIHPGLPPYTDTSGRGAVRVGRDCKPFRICRPKMRSGTRPAPALGARAWIAIHPRRMRIIRCGMRLSHSPRISEGKSSAKRQPRAIYDAP